MQDRDNFSILNCSKKEETWKLFITHLTTVCCCLSLPVVVAVAISCCLGRGSGCKIQLVGHEESLWWLFLLGSVDSSLAIGLSLLSADAPSYCQHKQAPNFHVWKVFYLLQFCNYDNFDPLNAYDNMQLLCLYNLYGKVIVL